MTAMQAKGESLSAPFTPFEIATRVGGHFSSHRTLITFMFFSIVALIAAIILEGLLYQTVKNHPKSSAGDKGMAIAAMVLTSITFLLTVFMYTNMDKCTYLAILANQFSVAMIGIARSYELQITELKRIIHANPRP